MLVELPSHSNSVSCSVANWGSYYTRNKFIFLSASVLKYMFDWFFLQPCLLVWLMGLQFVIDRYLDEKVYTVTSHAGHTAWILRWTIFLLWYPPDEQRHRCVGVGVLIIQCHEHTRVCNLKPCSVTVVAGWYAWVNLWRTCMCTACCLLDDSQLSRTHLFEHLVRGSYTWPQESNMDENVYTANLNQNLFCYIA